MKQNEENPQGLSQQMEQPEEFAEQPAELPQQEVLPVEKKEKGFIREWVLPLAAEVLVMLFLIKYVFFITVVPTGSMLPTIPLSSWLFATRIHNPEKRVSRGDIVVFNSEELDLVLIKRCVGLPGETVTIDEEGNVSINGEPLQEDYVKHPYPQEPQEFVVPSGHYLFFGDNRNGSIDARYWENPYIPAEEIQGEAHFILYPFNRFGVLS